jgi:hypothetical protein
LERALGDQKRPITVTAFEVLSIASLVIEIGLWGMEEPFWEGFAFSLLVALTLWISRGRSKAARLIYTGIFVCVAVLMIVASLRGELQADEAWTPTVVAITYALFLALLWWPATSDWLDKRHAGAAT